MARKLIFLISFLFLTLTLSSKERIIKESINGISLIEVKRGEEVTYSLKDKNGHKLNLGNYLETMSFLSKVKSCFIGNDVSRILETDNSFSVKSDEIGKYVIKKGFPTKLRPADINIFLFKMSLQGIDLTLDKIETQVTNY